MKDRFLTPQELAHRWNLALKTLSNWRCSGCGPEYHRMGSRVNYRIEDIEQFEADGRFLNTSDESNRHKKKSLKSFPLKKRA